MQTGKGNVVPKDSVAEEKALGFSGDTVGSLQRILRIHDNGIDRQLKCKPRSVELHKRHVHGRT